LRSTELVFSSGGSAQVTDDNVLVASHEYFVGVEVEDRKAAHMARAETRVQTLCAIEPDWLLDLEPSLVADSDQMSWDAERERVESVSRMTYDQLVMSESRGSPRGKPAAAELLAQQILSRGFERVVEAEAWASLLNRLRFLRENDPTSEWPAWPEGLQPLLVEFCQDKVTFAEAREGDLIAFLMNQHLTPQQSQSLDRLAPASIQLAKGRRAKIFYDPGKPPWVESRLQDFFGLTQGPSVLNGRVPLTLHLLAPNYRAVQVTSDLSGFWKRVYPELRKELGRRYPRHAWPEDPLRPLEQPKP
jgi:ATP-dependent helicase HrpB